MAFKMGVRGVGYYADARAGPQTDPAGRSPPFADSDLNMPRPPPGKARTVGRRSLRQRSARADTRDRGRSSGKASGPAQVIQACAAVGVAVGA